MHPLSRLRERGERLARMPLISRLFSSLIEGKAQSRAFRPLRGRVHFFCWHKRNRTKENAFPVHGKPIDSLLRGFFYGTSCPLEKRRTSMCAALRVSRRRVCLKIFRSQQHGSAARREGTCLLLGLRFGECLRTDHVARPEGRRTWMCAVPNEARRLVWESPVATKP